MLPNPILEIFFVNFNVWCGALFLKYCLLISMCGVVSCDVGVGFGVSCGVVWCWCWCGVMLSILAAQSAKAKPFCNAKRGGGVGACALG